MLNRNVLLASITAVTLVGSASAAITLTPLATFGGGDGWLAPGELPGVALGTSSLERGFAYNPVSGNLILVSRNGTLSNPIQILNGSTGAFISNLQQGSGIVTGGAFFTNMVGVADDGAIYVGNLSSSATSNFKVYRWGTEADLAPTVAFNALSGLPRTGDTLDVIGSGTGTKIVASGSGSDGYTYLSTADGLSFTGGAVNIAGDAAGDYRLGLTFGANDGKVLGTQGGVVRFSDVLAATLDASPNLGDTNLRLMDFAIVGGVPILAIAKANDSLVRIYDVSNPASPLEIASGTTTSGTLAANGNATGQVKFGAISGNTATLYAMATNQGIQAFTLTVPEPGTLGLAALGLALLAKRRR